MWIRILLAIYFFSISIHLTSLYAMSQMGDESRNAAAPFPGLHKSFHSFALSTTESYGPNLNEFLRRFDPKLTNDQVRGHQ